MEQKTLAQQCYDSEGVDMELFDKVNEILGCNAENCGDEGFVWGAEDTWWDSYDQSIEVVRPQDAEWMTEEQANSILDLGFGQIYESIGDQGRNWSNYKGEIIYSKGSPREAQEDRRLKATVAALRAELVKSRQIIQEFKSGYNSKTEGNLYYPSECS